MKKIKKDTNKLLQAFYNIDKAFFLDLIIELFNGQQVKNFCQKHSLFEYVEEAENIYDYYIIIAHTVFKDLNKEVLKDLLEYNTKAIERNNFQSFSDDDLLKNFSKDITFTESFMVSPEMIIAYYYNKNMYQNPKCLLALDFYKKRLEKDSEIWAKVELKDITGVLENARNKLDDVEKSNFEAYLEEDYVTISENFFEELAEEYDCKFENNEYNSVNKNFIAYIHSKFTNFNKSTEELESMITITYSIVKQAWRNLEIANSYIRQHFQLKEKIRQLEIKNRKLKRDLQSIESISKSNKNKDTKELEKENYYLKSELEKLQLRVSELEEEEKIKVEIIDNLPIEDITSQEKDILPQMQDIAILGGKWNSSNISELEDFFWQGQNSVEFFDADKLIRNQEKIKNADIIIFDTSSNSHKMFYKYRKNIDFIISKSNIQEIKKLFLEN